jgi:acetylornithine/succinyldiaminopimelate/putrescine aminotransferase
MGARRPRSRELSAADRRFLGREEPADDLQVVAAEGSHVTDERGRTYVDFTSGWCCGNLGWAAPALRQRLADFRGPDYVLPSAMYAPWVEIAAQLAALAPGKLVKSFRAVGGTEAVEIALQIARHVTGRRKLVKVVDGYHGNSMGVREVKGVVKPPLDVRALRRLDTALERRDVAAFIMEPVVCNLGVEIPTPEFMTGAQALCHRYGTLLILDEVATGFGRTGALFATEHYHVQPDLLCIAKAITGGYAPMGATLATAAVARELDDFSFYSTFGWHPLACEAALANLAFWRDRGAQVLAAVAERGQQFGDRLSAMDRARIRRVRRKGLAIGVELAEASRVERVVDRSRRDGLLVTGEERTLTLFPPLTIDAATADRGLDILEACLSRR